MSTPAPGAPNTRVLAGQCVVVTGATGFLGSHITLALLDAGAEVIGAVRTPAKGAWLVERGARMVQADLTDRASLVRAFAGVPTIVSNAAQGGHDADMATFERVNCQGLVDLFDAARDAGSRRIVHISSTAVYRTRLYARMDETTRGYDTDKRRFNWSDVTTDWRYARTKTLAERLAWERAATHGLALTTLRPGPIYGSRDEKATAILRAGLTGRFKLVPTVGVPWVHAGDVARAVVGALANPASAGRAYNLAGPPVSQHRFLREMRRLLGDLSRDRADTAAPGDRTGSAPRAGSPRKLPILLPVPLPVWVRYDTSAAERDLGFHPRPLVDGLREALS